MGQKMENKGVIKTTKKSGYEQIAQVYQAKRCTDCPMRGPCHNSKGERVVQVNTTLNEYRARAREKLLSEQGLAHRSQRPVDVEAVFGNIKQNKQFTRFLLRGIEKVAIEAGLMALAHNLAKAAKQRLENPFWIALSTPPYLTTTWAK